MLDEKLLLELTLEALSQSESIERNLLLKRVEIQHQVSCICTFIPMVTMENLLLVSVLELSMFYRIDLILHFPGAPIVEAICNFVEVQAGTLIDPPARIQVQL